MSQNESPKKLRTINRPVSEASLEEIDAWCNEMVCGERPIISLEEELEAILGTSEVRYVM